MGGGGGLLPLLPRRGCRWRRRRREEELLLLPPPPPSLLLVLLSAQLPVAVEPARRRACLHQARRRRLCSRCGRLDGRTLLGGLCRRGHPSAIAIDRRSATSPPPAADGPRRRLRLFLGLGCIIGRHLAHHHLLEPPSSRHGIVVLTRRCGRWASRQPVLPLASILLVIDNAHGGWLIAHHHGRFVQKF